MGIKNDIRNYAKENPNEIYSIKEYYNKNKDVIDRIEISKGKHKFDINQTFLSDKALELGWARFKEGITGGFNAFLNADIQDFENKGFKVENLKKEVEESRELYNELKNNRKKIQADIDNEIMNDPSISQRTIAAIGTNFLSQFTNPTDIALMISGEYFGKELIAKVGANTPFTKLALEITTQGLEEIAQESAYQLAFEDNFDSGEVLMAGLTGMVIPLGAKGIKKTYGLSKNIINTGNIKKIYSNTKENVFNAISNYKGDVDNVILDNTAVIIEQMKVNDSYTGRNGNAKKIFKESTLINDISVKTATEVYTKDVAEHFINDTRFPNINSIEDFTKYTDPTNKKQVYKDIKEILETDKITPYLSNDKRAAFNYFKNLIDNKKLNSVDVDINNLKSNINTYSETAKPKLNTPLSLEEKYSVYENVDIKKINSMFNEVKHNTYDFKKNKLIEELKKDLNIPKGAKNIKVAGNIPKTKIPIKTGIGADGNPVYTRNKFIKGDPNVVIKYEHDNKIYFHKANIEDGKWYSDTYITPKEIKTKNIKKTNKKVNIKEPETKISQKDFKIQQQASDDFKMVADIVKRRLGVSENISNAQAVNQAQLKVLREVGRVVKKRTGLNSLDDILTFYKNKYGIDFETGYKTFGSKGRVAEATEIKSGDTIKRGIFFNSTLDDDDLKIGVFRHEFQHLLDFERNKNFNGSNITYGIAKFSDTIENYLTTANKNHFANFENKWFELEYIIKNELEELINGDFLTSAKTLGLDLPKDISADDIKGIQLQLKGIPTNDVISAIKKAKLETAKYFNLKKSLKNILSSGHNHSQKSILLKEALETNILNPFYNVMQNMKNNLLSKFELEHNGNILNPEKVIDLFENNNENIISYLFFDGDIKSQELIDIYPQLKQLKENINTIIENLAEKTIVDPLDIKLSLAYDRNITIEKILGIESKDFLDSNLNFDEAKFLSGREVNDPLNNGKTIPQRQLKVRNVFVDENYKYFNDSNYILEHSLNRKKINSEEVYKNFIQASKTMQGDKLKEVYIKYNLEKNAQIKNFVESKKDIFSTKLEKELQLAIIKSKKRNAAQFFDNDMKSIKGDDLNKALGSAVHKLSRFIPHEYSGIISRNNLIKFVDENRVNQRLVLERMFKEIPNAYAIKEVFPKSSNTGFRQLLNSLQNSSSSPKTKDLLKDMERFINSNIGEKLGVTTKPTETKLDKYTKTFLKWTNNINLTGPKALREFGQEPFAMARAARLLYGRSGILPIYKDILKAIALIYSNGNEISKINKSLGGKYLNSIPLEYFNIIQDNLGDFTGYKKARLTEYGTNFQKVLSSLDKGINKVNFYDDTQRILKLASYLQAEPIINKMLSKSSLDDLFNSNTHYVKNVFNNLNISESEFNLFKNVLETESFKQRGIFDKIEFENTLTKEKLSEVFNRTLYDEEVPLYAKSIIDKFDNLYEKIVKDISPTEARTSLKYEVDMTDDEINRNFKRLMGNFKNSIQEQWRRTARDYYYSNVSSETGKFDWSNKVYQQRMLKHLLETGGGLVAITALTDSEFYADPMEYISDKIDELVDNPASPLWFAISEQGNLWGFSTGANAIVRPMRITGNIVNGDYEKAGTNLLKMGVNTTNYNMGKWLYEQLD